MSEPVKKGLSRKEYWDDFYTIGEGEGDHYEWYAETKDIEEFLCMNINNGDKILHIGCGNSFLAEQILGSFQFPNNLKIINVDYSELIIERVNERLSKLFGDVEDNNTKSKKKNKKNKPPTNKFPFERKFTRDQIIYEVGDITKLSYEDNSFDIVLDKGMLDAVLSHGDIETGENEIVKLVVNEVYRVLKENGKWLIISGNDSFITYSYFYGDLKAEWDVEMTDYQINWPSTNKKKTLYFYVLTALKKEPLIS